MNIGLLSAVYPSGHRKWIPSFKRPQDFGSSCDSVSRHIKRVSRRRSWSRQNCYRIGFNGFFDVWSHGDVELATLPCPESGSFKISYLFPYKMYSDLHSLHFDIFIMF